MPISTVPETVTIWTDGGVPTRMMWRGERFRVSDDPTPLSDLVAGITHPPSIVGWRFQGTDEAGISFVFDIRAATDGQEWELVRVYE